MTDSELDKLDEKTKEKLKRAIAAGTVITGAYLFDQITADEHYERDQTGKFVLKRKSTIEEIFE